VFTEKPVAMNSTEVAAMIEAKGDRIAVCASSRLQFLESAGIVKGILQSGKLGELRVFRVKSTIAPGAKPENPPAWRYSTKLNGGGLAMNWGCYDLDYIFWLLDWSCRPSRIWAKTWQCAPEFKDHIAPQSDGETHYLAQILCDNDLLINLERGEFVCGLPENYCEVIGTKAGLRFGISPAKGKKIIIFEKETAAGFDEKTVWQGDDVWETAHRGTLSDFVNSVINNREPATSLEKALIVQKTIDNIYESASKCQTVEC
jgi:predicted dehydrogenase